MDDPGFFSLLAHRVGREHRENHLSTAFAACFNHSPLFQQVTLEVLRNACGISTPLPRVEWTCGTEVSPPKGHDGGRVDISIRPKKESPTAKLPVFWLENKVTAPLTQKQLKKYIFYDCKYVIAVTKNRPEERPSDVGAYSLRWQDFHRALTGVKGAKGVERFLIGSFVKHLEELGMAHRRRITATQLKRLAAVWKAIRGENANAAVQNAFETADAVTELLESVRDRLVESYPTLGALRCSGPNCGFIEEDDDEKVSFDWLKLGLYRGRWAHFHFEFGMYFRRDDDSAWFDALVEGEKTKYEDADWPLRKVTTGGVLDEDKLFALVKDCAEKWGVV